MTADAPRRSDPPGCTACSQWAFPTASVASDVVPGAALSQLADGTVLAGALRAALDSGLLAHLDAVGGDTAPAAAS